VAGLVLFAVLALGAAIWWMRQPHAASVGEVAVVTKSAVAAATPAVAAQPAVAGLALPPVVKPADTAASLTQALRDLEAFFQSGHTPKEIAAALENLRTRLTHAPRAEALAAIYGYLGSGRNANTTLPFTVGVGGWLDNAPSLRVFLLDALGEVDPAEAAQYAKVILDSSDATPDEWAVSLRNLAQQNPAMASDPYLQQKARDLVTNSQWLQNPSAGFLQGFDFLVLTGQGNMAPLLASYMDNTTLANSVRYASYLTLDRLMMSDPAAVMQQLNADPNLLNSAPDVRAAINARADVTDPAQLAAVENYLLRPDLSPEELNQFADAFTFFSIGIGNNLATTQHATSLSVIAQRDVATLGVVNQWLADPNFASRQPTLQRLRGNLEEYIANEQEGGYLPSGTAAGLAAGTP
jgi:hypothetical protein